MQPLGDLVGEILETLVRVLEVDLEVDGLRLVVAVVALVRGPDLYRYGHLVMGYI